MTGTGVRIGKKTAGVRREMQEPFNSFAPDLASVNWRLFDYAPTSPSSLSSLPSLFSVLPLQIPTPLLSFFLSYSIFLKVGAKFIAVTTVFSHVYLDLSKREKIWIL